MKKDKRDSEAFKFNDSEWHKRSNSPDLVKDYGPLLSDGAELGTDVPGTKPPKPVKRDPILDRFSFVFDQEIEGDSKVHADIVKKRAEESGYVVKVFDTSLRDVIEEINGSKVKYGQGLVSKRIGKRIPDFTSILNNPNERFITTDFPELSLEVSHALSAVAQFSKSQTLKQTAKPGVLKRKERADEFAKNIYQVIQKVKEEDRVSTYKATIEALNKREIPTFKKGAKWQISSLQNLENRWAELGLTQSKPDQP